MIRLTITSSISGFLFWRPLQPDRHLDLVAFGQELLDFFQLDFDIVFADYRREFDLLDQDLALMALGLVGLLLQGIEKLAVIQDPADRRLGFRGDLDQVQFLFSGDFQGLGDGDDSDLVFFFVDQADFRWP